MVSSLTRNQVPACRLRVRAPCPPPYDLFCKEKLDNPFRLKSRNGFFYCFFKESDLDGPFRLTYHIIMYIITRFSLLIPIKINGVSPLQENK